jgi:glycosyltransferase involved in cell wall biosynthesis
MQNKKIMFFHSDAMSKSSGEERVITLYANYFTDQGHKVTIAHLGKKNNCFFKLNSSIKLIQIPRSRILLAYKFIIAVIKYKPDIIIAIDPLANRYAALAKYALKQVIVVGMEHFYASHFAKNRYGTDFLFFKKYFYSRLDSLVVLTQESADWLNANTHLTNNVVIANPLVYPLPIISNSLMPNQFIQNNSKTLLAVGRLEQQKGFDLLIDMFATITNKYNNWQLIILGEGTQRHDLEQQIAKLGLQQRVLMLGAVGNLHHWYSAADVFVFSSRFEGLPCVLLEAMAYGLPVVSFACKTGPAEIIEHGVNGLLVPVGNTTAFTQELSRLIEDKKLRQQLATKAVEVRKKYSMEIIYSQWLQLFTKLAKKL